MPSGIVGISYLHLQHAGFCRPQNIGRTQKPSCRQRQRGSKTKKGTNTTANPSYVSKKISLPQLLYIVYQIFRRAQIFVGFFGWQQMTTIGIQCSIRQSVQYSSAGIRNFAFLQQFFVPSYLYTGEQSLLLATVLPSGLTGPHSPARLIFFTGQISDFRLRTTFLPRRLRRRQPRFRSHKQISKRTSKRIPQKNFKNNFKNNPKKHKQSLKKTTKRTSLPRKRKSLLSVSETKNKKEASPANAWLARLLKRFQKVKK